MRVPRWQYLDLMVVDHLLLDDLHDWRRPQTGVCHDRAGIRLCIIALPTVRKTLKKRVDRLAQGNMQMSYTNTWAASASIILQDTLGQSKATTPAIERHHCRQRHWFRRFTRKPIIISQSQEMVDLTMALCAKFWSNGN